MAISVNEINVVGPAGGNFTVLTEAEEELFNDLARRYTTDNHFQNISDLQDLERVIHMEVLNLRYSNWMSTESDYYGSDVDLRAIGGLIKDFSMELRQLKKSVGIDRTSRHRDTGESLPDYWSNLKERAEEFGIHRENQLTSALTLFNELMALITLHDNANDAERKKLKCTADHIIDWVRDTAIPQYKAVDKHFIESQQRFWVQDQ